MCFLSALSGFSCVYVPFQRFRYFDPLVNQINKEKIEDDMRLILKDIKAEKLELAHIKVNKAEVVKKEKKGFFGGFMGSLFGKKRGAVERSAAALRKSIKLNQQLLDTLFIDYRDISEDERNMRMAKRRRCRNYLDKVIAVFLLSFGMYKVGTTGMNLIIGRKKPSDPINNTLKFLAK